MARADMVRALLERHGTSFSQDVGIDLTEDTPSTFWSWYLTCLQLSARISSDLAVRATRAYLRAIGRAERSLGLGDPAVGLERLTRSELYELARQVDLIGRSSMSRRQLVDALGALEIGHETEGRVFCYAHCAHQAGVEQASDRA